MNIKIFYPKAIFLNDDISALEERLNIKLGSVDNPFYWRDKTDYYNFSDTLFDGKITVKLFLRFNRNRLRYLSIYFNGKYENIGAITSYYDGCFHHKPLNTNDYIGYGQNGISSVDSIFIFKDDGNNFRLAYYKSYLKRLDFYYLLSS